jgi:hypothetical protein
MQVLGEAVVVVYPELHVLWHTEVMSTWPEGHDVQVLVVPVQVAQLELQEVQMVLTATVTPTGQDTTQVPEYKYSPATQEIQVVLATLHVRQLESQG